MVRERRNWTAEEDALLKNAVELARSGDSQSLPWNAIALRVPGRTNKDCRKRFHYKVSSNVNRGAWTRTEDERLRAAVQKYGFKWCRVAVDVGTRNGDQCSKRWKNTIDPCIDRSAWSAQDEHLLTKSVEKLGHNWKAIVNTHFPGRTALQARNQYNQIRRRTGSDTQPSTPGSMQSPAAPLATKVSLPHVSFARTRSRRQQPRNLPADTELENEESDDNISSEDENDDDADWSQSEKYLQLDPANEISHLQARRSPSHQYDMSPVEIERFTSPLPSDGMLPFSSFDHFFPDQSVYALGDTQVFEPASNELCRGDQVTDHSLAVEPPSQRNWIGFSESLPATLDSSLSNESRKQVVISATCSNSELQNLIQTTAGALESVSFAITSQHPLSMTKSSSSLEGCSRLIVITASCLPDELGKLMQVVTDTMGSVNFSVSSNVT